MDVKRFLPFWDAETKLGISRDTRRYDLPLEADSGTNFLILLTALMTFLAVVSLTGYSMTRDVTKRWSSGLQNKITIEIMAEAGTGGAMRDDAEISALAIRVKQKLADVGGVESIDILSDRQVRSLIEPWLGNLNNLGGIPLPGLVAVTLKQSNAELLKDIKKRVAEIGAGIRVDTHREWLEGLLRITHGLQWGAMMLAMIIVVTTAAALTSAMRARMQIHREDIELLYLMGASDSYISRQFGRHAWTIAQRGGFMGTMCSIGFVLVLILVSGFGTMGGGVLSWSYLLLLVITPLLVCVISTVSAWYTVFRTLRDMP